MRTPRRLASMPDAPPSHLYRNLPVSHPKPPSNQKPRHKQQSPTEIQKEGVVAAARPEGSHEGRTSRTEDARDRLDKQAIHGGQRWRVQNRVSIPSRSKPSKPLRQLLGRLRQRLGGGSCLFRHASGHPQQQQHDDSAKRYILRPARR